MALSTKWQARVSAQTAVNLTNPDVSGATTVDTDRLDAAVEDVSGAFRVLAEWEYDDTDNRHVGIACIGVTAFLQMQGSSSMAAGEKNMKRFEAKLDELRMVGPRARGVPTTNAPFTRTDEGANRTTVRPSFDTENFDGLIPDAPRRDSDGDDSRLN